MKTRRISQLCAMFVCALPLLLGMVTVARAADPWPWEQIFPWPTSTPWPTPHVLGIGERFSLGVVIVPATPIPLPANFLANPAPVFAPAPPLAAPQGGSPQNALSADGSPRTLAPGASAWYRIGKGGEHIDAFLDANPLSGMSFSVYAPGNLSDPIGQGTLQKSSGRLVWAGGHWNSAGDWFARVTNSNPMAVGYTLTSSGRDISNKSCYSYWENYPTGELVYWTECQ